VLGATTVKFIACYMFRSYGELWAIKYVITKTRVKMLVTFKKIARSYKFCKQLQTQCGLYKKYINCLYFIAAFSL